MFLKDVLYDTFGSEKQNCWLSFELQSPRVHILLKRKHSNEYINI